MAGLLQPTFQDYLVAVIAAQLNHPGWRIGQAYFNVLFEMKPELANRLRNTSLDPFHNYHVLPRFLAEVVLDWERF